MAMSREIRELIEDLPETAQDEVLDFIEFLKSKQSSEDDGGNKLLNEFSLRSAMRGIDGTEEPDYSTDDIVETI